MNGPLWDKDPMRQDPYSNNPLSEAIGAFMKVLPLPNGR